MRNALEEFLRKQVTRFRKKAYLLRAVKSARKTLDITCSVQSGFLIERKIDEKTGLGKNLLILANRTHEVKETKSLEF